MKVLPWAEKSKNKNLKLFAFLSWVGSLGNYQLLLNGPFPRNGKGHSQFFLLIPGCLWLPYPLPCWSVFPRYTPGYHCPLKGEAPDWTQVSSTGLANMILPCFENYISTNAAYVYTCFFGLLMFPLQLTKMSNNYSHVLLLIQLFSVPAWLSCLPSPCLGCLISSH